MQAGMQQVVIRQMMIVCLQASSKYMRAVCQSAFEEDACLDEGVVDAGAVGHEEAGAGGELMEHEELHLRAHFAVVALLGLLHAVLVVRHLLLVRERHPIHPLRTQPSPIRQVETGPKQRSRWFAIMAVSLTGGSSVGPQGDRVAL